MLEKFLAGLVIVVGGLSLVLLVSFLLAWPVMALWNGCLVPAVSGTHEIGWMQAWGISVLSHLLVSTMTTVKK